MLVKKSVLSAREAAWVNKAGLPCETGLTVSMRSYVDNCVLFPDHTRARRGLFQTKDVRF